MLTEIKKALGNDFASKPAAIIGQQGWSAPFDVDQAFIALSKEGYYQSSINVFILKLLCNDDGSINYRNVKYLADYYFKASEAMSEATSFRLEPDALGTPRAQNSMLFLMKSSGSERIWRPCLRKHSRSTSAGSNNSKSS